MNRTFTLLALAAGTCFGLWPLIMKRATLQPMIAAVVLNGVTVAIMLIAYFARDSTEPIHAGPAIIAPAFIAGVINAVGNIFFFRMISGSSRMELPKLILLMVLTQIVMNELGGILFQGSPLTLRKGAGFGTAILAAVLLVL